MDVTLTGVLPTQTGPVRKALGEAGLTAREAPWTAPDQFGTVVVADLREIPSRAPDVAGWREAGLTAPVLVLAVPGDTHLRALEAGADDYLLAPFEPTEVAGRVVALLRRASSHDPQLLQLRDGTLDLETREVSRGGQTTRLTATEARLVTFLARNPASSFSRDQLQVQVWGYRAGIRSRTVFTTVQRVRVKLEADPAAPVHLVTDPKGRYRLVGAQQPIAAPTAPSPGPAFFVGRGDELDALGALVSGSQGAMVTVVGPGGMGKTHLVTELAARTAASFRDGAVMVELASVDDDSAVAPTILEALRAERGPDPIASLIDALRQRELLLVLDNLEHLPGLPGLLTTLLASRPAAALVATSRVPMRLQRESVFPLEGLPVDEAVALFRQTAARSRVGWSPEEGDEERMRAIVERVGGVPLGVVLAASWARALTVSDIASELDRDLDLLDEGPRDLPERHRSARAVFEGSWTLLSADQQALLAALSSFRTPFSRDAARAVAAASLTDLLRLVDASLLRRGADRYDLHPLLTELVRGKLRDSGQDEAVDARHTAWFATELERWNQQLRRLERDDEDIGREVDAVRADVWHVWCRAAERLDVGLLFSAADPLMRGTEGTPRMASLMQPVLRALGPMTDDEPTPRRALRALAIAIRAGGRTHAGAVDTMPDIHTALALLDGLQGREAQLARAQTLLARHVVRLFSPDGAPPEEVEEATLAHRLVGNLRAEVLSTATQLYCLGRAGRAEEVDALQPALLANPLVRGRNRGRCLMYASLAQLELGRWARALPLIVEAQADLQRAGEPLFACWAGSLRAHIEAHLGSPAALTTTRDALDDALALHLPELIGAALLAAVGHAWVRGIDPPPRAEQRAVGFAARCVTMSTMRPATRIGQEVLDLLEPQLEPEVFASWVAAGETLDVTEAMQQVLSELSET